MKYFSTAALVLSFGVAAIHAQALNINVSGSTVPSTVDLGTGTPAGEYQLAGNGTFGNLTVRVVSASAASPQSSSTCSGLYIPVVAGMGVVRVDGDLSLLTLNLTGGSDCIDLAAGRAVCTRIFSITGGTGRFKNATGNLTLNMDVVPIVPTNFAFFYVTGDIRGMVSGASGQGSQNGQ